MLSLLSFTGAAVPAAQQSGEVLCPSSGLPVSTDPGCWARENTNAAQQQQMQQPPPRPQPTGWWEKTWGAIAPSPVGGVLGTALGARSKEEAERLALDDCEAKGGRACEVNLAYHNQCAVMIVGDDYLTSYSNATIEEATRRGLRECSKDNSNCRVYYSACTEPIFHKY
jgi:hypothetical protein